MITTRTRVLSLLATVAMVISMVACFVIPASAADDLRAAYLAVCDDAVDGTADQLREALEDETTDESIWAFFVSSVELKEDVLPRYAYKAAYEAAGYEGASYAISEPADWLAMITDSASETFEGKAFYLTNDVDFNNAQMAPLNDDASVPFKGAIYGQGYAFKKVNVLFNQDKINNSGMIGKIGAATIDNFGVDSGIIDIKGNNYQVASLFGQAKGAAKISRVWCGATIKCSTWHGTTTGFISGCQDTNATLNGVYFYGTLTATTNTTSSYLSQDKLVFTGENSRGTHVYNSIANPTSSDGVDGIAKYNAASQYVNGDVQNTYAIGTYKFFQNDVVTVNDTTAPNCGFVDSAVEAAWKINNLQATSSLDKVYYSFNENGDIRFGDETNRISKITVTGDVEREVIMNAGTIDLEKDLELYIGEGATYTIGEETLGTTFTATGDTTITATVTEEGKIGVAKAAIANFEAKYGKYDAALMADGTLKAYKDAKAAADALAGEEGELAALEAAVAAGEAVNLALSNTYPILPQYKDYALYKDLNTANKWLIKETADWTAMIAANSGFAGYEFHLANDIDFNNVKMAPLGVNIEFKATIDGHGYAFKNVNVEYTSPAGSQAIGLICWLGAPAKISNFGVDNGLIRVINNNYHTVGTFSGKVSGAVQLNNVWSGVKLRSDGGSSYLMGILGGGLADTGAVINGAYFFGAMQVNFSNNANSFSIAGENARGIKAYNTLTAPYDNNGIDAIAKLHNGNNNNWINNAYTGVGDVFAAAPFQFTGTSGGAADGDKSVGTIAAASALEGAYKLNVAQATSTAPSKAYFTFNANGDIRPTSDASKMIVKYTITGDVEKTGYINAGEIDLVEDLGLIVGEGATITLDEAPAAEQTITVTKDFVLNVTYSDDLKASSALALIAEAEAKYADLDVNVLKTTASEGKVTLADWKAMVADAKGEEGSLAKLEAAVDAIANIEIAITDDYTKLPAFSDHNIYKEYNASNNWLIKTADDWKKMMAAASATSGDTYFTGYTFHLAADVDFADAGTLAPMAVAKYFGGTINGHGYGFSNLTIVANDIVPNNNTVDEYMADSYPGLFYRMGNCVLQDFGINSGSFKVTYGGAGTSITAFGYFKGKKPTLTRTWFGADMTKGSGSNTISVLGHECADSGAVINGFYFYGSTVAANSNITGSNSRGNKYYNIIAAPKNVKAADNISIAFRTDLLADTAGSDGTIGNYKTSLYDNVYGVGYTQAYQYRTSASVAAPSAAVIAADNARLLASSANEAAFKINTNPSTGTTPVYYSFNANGDLRPVASADKMIIKVVLTGDEDAVLYFNKDTVADLKDDLGIEVGADTVVTVGGLEYTESTITLTANVTTIDVDYSLKTVMNEAVAPFINMDPEHLTNGDELQELLDAAEAANEADDDTLCQIVIETAEAFVPQITTDYKKVPTFSDYAIYAAYNTANNWLIKTADDWKAMIAAADASNSFNSKSTPNYFKGYTFHLAADVDFAEAGVIPMMGDGKMFSGNINGHGYGFNNIEVVFNKTVDTGNHKSGLIHMFEGTMQDFGINSGSITATSTGTGNVELGMIGGFSYGNGSGNETKAKLLRVWNDAAMITSGHSDNGTSPAVGYHTQDLGATINGFYSNSTLSITSNNNKSLPGSGLVAGNSRGLNVYNVISEVDAGYLLVYGNADTAKGATIKNVFATKVENFYTDYNRNVLDNANNAGAASAASGAEAAWKINNNQISGIEPVYYTYVNGKIRPTADATYAIVKVAVTGDAKTTIYLNKNTEYGVADLADALGVSVAEITGVTMNGAPVTGNISLTGDAAIEVTLDICDHPSKTYTWVDGTETHKAGCDDCDWEEVVACDGTFAAAEVDLTNGTSKHTKTCSACKHLYEEVCNGTLVKDTADCTKDSKWTFDCVRGLHDAEYVITGSGNAEHTFDGAWTVEGDQAYRKCANCDVKEYCAHTNVTETWIEGTETHKIVCDKCGYETTGNCDGTYAAAEVNMTDGTSKHTKTCSACKHLYEEVCNGTLVKDTVNCKNNSKWVFENCEGNLHTEIEIPNSGKADHVFPDDWTVDGDQQYRKCDNCDVKEYRSIGKISAVADGTVQAGGEIEVTLKLGVALKSGIITLTPSAGFTVTNVEGENISVVGNVITATNTDADAEIVVTLAADKYAVVADGTLAFALTNAIGADDMDVTDASIDAVLPFERVNGDADGNRVLELLDALIALCVATDIDVDYNLANADMNADGLVKVEDALAIVLAWLMAN